jgi:hypothetical protein
MSTTTHKETAFAYSGVKEKRGTVLEIDVAHIDVGASISFLSQYPGEAEFLMQPLACLEVTPAPRKPPLRLTRFPGGSIPIPDLPSPVSPHSTFPPTPLLWHRSRASSASTAPPTARSARIPPHPTPHTPSPRRHRPAESTACLGRQVVVVPLRVNANLKGLTLEGLIERRKARPSPHLDHTARQPPSMQSLPIGGWACCAGRGVQAARPTRMP